ncbi:hypothetical protein TKK_0014906 [Trichogramma kaykai]|uniref:RING-type domain-containing protein n=1 Tax=Trichogramma kaykai TaxID=54128 RepID=A0ABD2WDA9_9HYME
MSEFPMIAIGREELLLDIDDSRRDRKEDATERSHGFHLVRSKWDPYPWIGPVEKSSSADVAGLRSGDCLLGVDGRDVLGLEMNDIGHLIGKNDRVNLSIWRRPGSSNEPNLARFSDNEQSQHQQASVLMEGPLPEVAQKLARAVSGIVKALECPVCLESASPPVSQCVHGHLLCYGCRLKTDRCPVCRVRLGRGRCLLADKVHRLLSQELVADRETRSLRDCILGAPPAVTDHCPHEINDDRRLAKRPRVKRLLEKLLLTSSSSRAMEPEAELLTGSTESIDGSAASSVDGNMLYGRRWLLRLYDRRKSASTGELDRNGVDADLETARSNKTSFTDLTFKSAASTSLLCVPQMSYWGASTESMTASRISCPLSLLGRCHQVLDSSNLMEHLEDQHDGPIVHFYKRRVTLPFPCPFQGDAIYALHQKDDILILQTHEDKIWIGNVQVDSRTRWEWMLHVTSIDGNEIHLRKEVANLHEPCQLMSHQVASIPDNFVATSLTVSLIEINSNEGCVKV